MTTSQPAPTITTRGRAQTPLIAAAFGFVVYFLAMLAGEVFELNADPDGGVTMPDDLHLTEALIGLAGVALAGWLAHRATRTSGHADRYALGMSIAAVLTMVAFWTGWPTILGGAAIGLVVEERRRLGSLSVMAAVAGGLGAAAFVLGAVLCVTG